MQFAREGIALVNGSGVIARVPPENRHHVGQSASRLGECDPDGVAAVDEATVGADAIVVVRRCDVQAQPGKFGCAGDDVAAAVEDGAHQIGIEVPAGYPLSIRVEVPTVR